MANKLICVLSFLCLLSTSEFVFSKPEGGKQCMKQVESTESYPCGPDCQSASECERATIKQVSRCNLEVCDSIPRECFEEGTVETQYKCKVPSVSEECGKKICRRKSRRMDSEPCLKEEWVKVCEKSPKTVVGLCANRADSVPSICKLGRDSCQDVQVSVQSTCTRIVQRKKCAEAPRLGCTHLTGPQHEECVLRTYGGKLGQPKTHGYVRRLHGMFPRESLFETQGLPAPAILHNANTSHYSHQNYDINNGNLSNSNLITKISLPKKVTLDTTCEYNEEEEEYPCSRVVTQKTCQGPERINPDCINLDKFSHSLKTLCMKSAEKIVCERKKQTREGLCPKWVDFEEDVPCLNHGLRKGRTANECTRTTLMVDGLCTRTVAKRKSVQCVSNLEKIEKCQAARECHEKLPQRQLVPCTQKVQNCEEKKKSQTCTRKVVKQIPCDDEPITRAQYPGKMEREKGPPVLSTQNGKDSHNPDLGSSQQSHNSQNAKESHYVNGKNGIDGGHKYQQKGSDSHKKDVDLGGTDRAPYHPSEKEVAISTEATYIHSDRIAQPTEIDSHTEFASSQKGGFHDEYYSTHKGSDPLDTSFTMDPEFSMEQKSVNQSKAFALPEFSEESFPMAEMAVEEIPTGQITIGSIPMEKFPQGKMSLAEPLLDGEFQKHGDFIFKEGGVYTPEEVITDDPGNDEYNFEFVNISDDHSHFSEISSASTPSHTPDMSGRVDHFQAQGDTKHLVKDFDPLMGPFIEPVP